MPFAAPRLCTCGRVVPAGKRCECSIKRKAENDRRRPTAQARGYGQAWRDARKAWLAAHPKCVMCGGSANVVDHRIPHRGNMKLFWDRSNWQSLCASPCHNRHKQRDEQ
nr:HNH endonuclease [Bradyrhizobium manausense]